MAQPEQPANGARFSLVRLEETADGAVYKAEIAFAEATETVEVRYSGSQITYSDRSKLPKWADKFLGALAEQLRRDHDRQGRWMYRLRRWRDADDVT